MDIPSGLKSVRADFYIGSDRSIWHNPGFPYAWYKLYPNSGSGGDLSDYYTKEQVDFLISQITTGGVSPISSPRYNSQDTMDSQDNHTVVISALIGADLSFFRAYRGNGSVLSGFTTAATEDSVMVDVSNGKVTFYSPFDPAINERIAFDYLPGSVVPPEPIDSYFVAGYVADGYTV